MKTRHFFILFIAVTGLFSTASAQSIEQPSMVFKVNPLIMFGKRQVYFEVPVSQSSSVELSLAQFNSWKEISLPMSDPFEERRDLSHWLVMPAYRHYLNGNALKGAYISLYGRGKFSEGRVDVAVKSNEFQEDYDHRRSVSELGGGIVIGKQWITKKNVVFDLFAGTGSSYRLVSNRYDAAGMNDQIYERDVLDGLSLDRWVHQLRIGFTIGLAL